MEGESTSSGVLAQETEDCPHDDKEVAEKNALIQRKGTCYGDLDGEGYVKMLFERENSSGFKKDQSLALENWVKSARLEAVDWVLKTRERFVFRLQIAYLSMTYFDRYLSRRPINSGQSWAVRLLSVACLSLAVKMKENQIPSLSQFQIEGFNFGSNAIRRMELLVLGTLEWKMVPVTAFPFVPYFIEKFCKESPPKVMISKAAGFILAVMREINLVDHPPSVIAVAATLVALDVSLTRQALENKINSISCPGFLEIEDVFQCYVVMQKLEAENINTPISVNSPDFILPI